jgi:hypothetical protein
MHTNTQTILQFPAGLGLESLLKINNYLTIPLHLLWCAVQINNNNNYRTFANKGPWAVHLNWA